MSDMPKRLHASLYEKKIEQLQAELKAKDGLLQKYGHHITAPRCSWFDMGGVCTCGFEQALKGE